ncbi:MAG: pilus assembly protein PilM [Parcubacteria group bacterium]|nr:pilus assembly protein PilM [Parcubacteria group bacterium]
MSMLSGLFKQQASSFLGVDMGSGSIKLVELVNVSGRPRLATYGMVEIETNVSRDDAKESERLSTAALTALLEKSGARSRTAIGALPNFSVFSSVLSLPARSEAEMAAAVQWEAKKFVPMPLENVVLDWKVLETKTDKPSAVPDKAAVGQKAEKMSAEPEKTPPLARGGAVRILLTAAPKHLVERYVSIFKAAGLNLLSLETESFALGRSLVGNDPAPVLVVDAGSLTTDLTVVERGIPVFSRSISVGGKTITTAVANSMGIDEARAEQFKRDVGLGEGTDAGVAGIVSASFAAVVNEMRYLLDVQKESGSSPVEKVLLTGGSAFLPSLDSFLSQSLGIKTFIANPWARVSHPKELAGVLDALGPRMAVAVGLAMRELG